MGKEDNEKLNAIEWYKKYYKHSAIELAENEHLWFNSIEDKLVELRNKSGGEIIRRRKDTYEKFYSFLYKALHVKE